MNNKEIDNISLADAIQVVRQWYKNRNWITFDTTNEEIKTEARKILRATKLMKDLKPIT